MTKNSCFFTLSQGRATAWVKTFTLLLLAFGIFSQQGFAQSDDPRETLSLDGQWEIIFDYTNEGRGFDWQNEFVFKNHVGRKPIEVPGTWEEIEKDYEGVAFYGRSFFVPEEWKGKVIYLEFDAVNYIAQVYVNDMPVGRNEGGYAPFDLRVDHAIKPGQENFVSLRILGPIIAQNKVIDGIGWNDMPHWRGAITGGIWQNVRLIATGSVRVDDVFVQPNISDNTAKVDLVIENKETKAVQKTLEVTIGSQKKSETMSFRPGTNKLTWNFEIPNARYWSVEDPHLYKATVTVKDSDQVSTNFGMREFTIANNQFVLNGKPIYLKAAFFEGLYPVRMSIPDTEEMARKEIQLAKDGGFNMIRPWRKPPPPMWLDLCDEMGMLVVGGMPIECMGRWPTATPELEYRIVKTVEDAVLRDRNRASVVQWELFNEILRPELARLKHPVALLTRELDPTRLILDESGGFSGGANIYLPYQFETVPFNDVHAYPGFPFSASSYDNFLTLGKTPEQLKAMGLEGATFTGSQTLPGRLSYISEIGYGSPPNLVEINKLFEKYGNPLAPAYRYHKMLAESIMQVLRENGLDSIYPDLEEFCLQQQELHAEANKLMLEAIRSNEDIGGYCVHALTGGDWVLGAGLLDLFRNPKASYWSTKEANAPQYLALRIRPRNIYAEQGAKITVNGINELKPVSGKLALAVTSPAGKTVYESETDVGMGTGVNELLAKELDTKNMSGSYTATVKLTDEQGKVVAENTFEFDVFTKNELVAPKSKIAVLDVNDSLKPFLTKAGIPFDEFGPGTPISMPVFVSKSYANTDDMKARFAALEKFVGSGGTAVYLESVLRGSNPYWGGYRPP
ncbi:MAG: glycoside hydrolase family 2 TIM barrel-domain containing protein, partial [Verrucomicrobiota bacterium]